MVLFEVKDFKHQSARFGDDWKEGMAKPMLELVRQIQAVWRDYMNLEVMAGISSPVVYSQMDEALGQDISLLKWSALYGSYGICTYWDMKEFLENMEKEQKRCAILLNALFSGDPIGIEEGRQAIFSNIDRLPVKEAGNRMLHFICLLADRFKEYELDFSGVFPEPVDYYQKIGRLETIGEISLWLNNYISWVANHLELIQENRQDICLTLLMALQFPMLFPTFSHRLTARLMKF